MAALIVACEVGFWLMLGAGLVARYPLSMRRTSTVLLVGTPMLDVVLLVATVFDLRGGAAATVVHGLGAAYLGFSVAFGHGIIRWADQRFAHRLGRASGSRGRAGGPAEDPGLPTAGRPAFASSAGTTRPWEFNTAGGPAPVKPPKHGPERVRREWREWSKCVLASGIACAVMALLVFVVGTPDRTEVLWQPPGGWIPRLGILTAIWFAVGPLWTILSHATSVRQKEMS